MEAQQEQDEASARAQLGFDYFASKKKHVGAPLYDRIHHVGQEYDCKLHRDDRRHIRSLGTCEEEKHRTVPVLTSSTIGKDRGLVVDKADEKNVRSYITEREFWSRTGPPVPLGNTLTFSEH